MNFINYSCTCSNGNSNTNGNRGNSNTNGNRGNSGNSGNSNNYYIIQLKYYLEIEEII